MERFLKVNNKSWGIHVNRVLTKNQAEGKSNQFWVKLKKEAEVVRYLPKGEEVDLMQATSTWYQEAIPSTTIDDCG